jgi:hypothetical protein
VFERLDDQLVSVPPGDFDPAIDVVEPEAALGGKWQRPVEILLKRIRC